MLEFIIAETLLSCKNDFVLKLGFPINPKLYKIDSEIYCGIIILNRKYNKFNGLFFLTKRNLSEDINAKINKTEDTYIIKGLPFVKLIK